MELLLELELYLKQKNSKWSVNSTFWGEFGNWSGTKCDKQGDQIKRYSFAIWYYYYNFLQNVI